MGLTYKKYFIQAIRSDVPGDADRMIDQVEKHFRRISQDTRFAAKSGNPIDRRLDLAAYFLAYIITLDERGFSYESIRRKSMDIVLEYVRPKNPLQKFMKRIPAMLVTTWLARWVFRKMENRVRQRSHPDGFAARIITDKQLTYGLGYGFDITECGICKLFTKHNYGKYASILCEVDKVTSNQAGLELIRTGTIALGAEKCDFRFKKAARI